MPAIQLARLRTQTAALVEYFDQPVQFVRELHHLLDFYADRTHRPGQAGEPPPLLTPYNVPKPVLRQILRELTPQAEATPQAGLELAQALWAEPFLEFRLLAGQLLGCIPPASPQAILEQAQRWISSLPEQRLMETILSAGLQQVRRQMPTLYLDHIQTRLEVADNYQRSLGLQMLVPLLEEQDFDNFPIIFQLLTPHAREIPSALRADLVDVFFVLAHRIPNETAHFLKEILNIHNSSDTAWLIRQCLPELPQETGDRLRQTLRNQNQNAPRG